MNKKFFQIRNESSWRGTSNCHQCAMRDAALFADLNDQDIDLIHAPIDDLKYEAGSSIFDQGDKAVGVYTLRKGLIKLVRLTSDGRERIVRVAFPGDVVGIEALASGSFNTQAVALVNSEVCRIPISVIQKLGIDNIRLHKKLIEKWNDALKLADDWLVDLNFGTAKQRVIQFVKKMYETSLDGTVVLFRREDMGAMLDLKFETVSREVALLVRLGILKPLDKIGRNYLVASPEGLNSL